MPLTVAQCKKAQAMANDGQTAGMIAAEFRVTRNSIVGYINRWKQAGLVTGFGRKPHPKPAPAVEVAPVLEPAPEPEPTAVKPSRPRTAVPPMVTSIRDSALGVGPAVFALGPLDCRWPIGDVEAADFRFCCQRVRPGPVGQPPYCLTHLRLALSGERALRRFGAEP